MNADFVEAIEYPHHPELRRFQADAREAVTERLEAYDMTDVPEHVVRKLTYAYYHDWTTDDPDYVFLLQDPGVPGEHVVLEVNAYAELGPEADPLDVVQVDRRFGSRWLATGRYTDFTAGFVAACREHGLIDEGPPWWRYLLGGGFFEDFYMGDVIKYRAANPGTGGVNVAFTEHLIDELEAINPELVFTFGKTAWEALRNRLDATAVGASPSGQGITDVHGTLHRTGRLLETALLPLGHPSSQFRGAQISKGEYMDGVRDGLATFTVYDR